MMKNVTIYTTPACPFCVQAKRFMQERDLSYTEHNVKEDLEKRHEMVEVSGQMGVPVIVVGEQVLIGFNPEKLGKALEE